MAFVIGKALWVWCPPQGHSATSITMGGQKWAPWPTFGSKGNFPENVFPARENEVSYSASLLCLSSLRKEGVCFAKIKRFALSFPQKEKLFFRSFPYLSANFSRHTDRPSVLFCRIAKSLFFRESFAFLTCPTFPHAVNFNLRDCRKVDLIHTFPFSPVYLDAFLSLPRVPRIYTPITP